MLGRSRRPRLGPSQGRGSGGLTPPGDEPLAHKDPYQLGLRLLARRDFTVAQLRARLADHVPDEEAVDAALTRLADAGAVDDRRVAFAYASTAARVKGRGPLRILRELREMGVPDALAREAVDAAAPLDEADARLERALARHLRSGIRDERSLRRAYAALLRLGFDPSQIRAALRRHGASDPEAVGG